MSIQELVRCDSIVAPKLPPADFCIGTEGTFRLRLPMSAHWDDQTCRGRALTAEFDPTRTFALEPSALGLREEVVADDAPFVIDCEKADASGNHLAGFRTHHVPLEFYDTGQRLDRRGGPEDATFLDDIALIGCSDALLERTMSPHILCAHKMPTIGHPKGPHHLASPRRIAFVPDADEGLHNALYAVHVPPRLN
jgi:hypothetical protein